MTKYSKKQERKDLIEAIKAAMNCRCTAQNGVNGVVKPVESIRQQIIKIYKYRKNNKSSSKLLKSMNNRLKNFLADDKEIKNVRDVKEFLNGLTKIKGGIGTVWNNKVKKGIEEGVKTKLKMENNKHTQLNLLKSYIRVYDDIEHKELKEQVDKLKNIEKEMKKYYGDIDKFISLGDESIEIYKKIDEIENEVKQNKEAPKEEKKEINTMDKKANKLLKETEENIGAIEKNLKIIDANKNIG